MVRAAWLHTLTHATKKQIGMVILSPFSVRQYLTRMGNHLNSLEISTFMADLTAGVAHCHRHGVLHSDLKHDNLLLRSMPGTETGPGSIHRAPLRLVLCDFSSAALVEEVQPTAQESLRPPHNYILGSP